MEVFLGTVTLVVTGRVEDGALLNSATRALAVAKAALPVPDEPAELEELAEPAVDAAGPLADDDEPLLQAARASGTAASGISSILMRCDLFMLFRPSK